MSEHLPNHDCNNFIKKVFLVLDGELPDNDRKLFIQDIERCKGCLEHYDIEKSFKDFINAKFDRKSCSKELKKEIIAKISQMQTT